jgi:predicted unusual protein kinase regulating ubiquinone biosynthesis (AarF/ABC1/UbiB family)
VSAVTQSGSAAERNTRTQPSGWRLRLRVLWRTLVVLRTLLPFAWVWARDRKQFIIFGRSRSVDTDEQRRRARALKDAFIGLGPTFIKLGQILSTRPDALPRAYIDVLSELQDTVPPAPWEDIEPMLEREFGVPISERFDRFDTDPISGASLGQVYEATIDGEQVAVKVLRPGIRERVESDLRVLSTLTPILVSGADPGQAYTLENVTEEFAATIRREMDYAHEAKMLRAIGDNFADDDGIEIPTVYDEYSTDRVVTMAYIDGVKIDNTSRIDELGIDRRDLVRRLEQAYIRMIVEDGQFHADPHPGNLAVKSDGTVVFYDFGMTGRLSPHTREKLMEFYIGLATDDVDRVMDAFVAMGALDPAADRDVMREAFEIVIEQFRGEDISEYRVEQLVGQFETQLYEFPMRLPQELALVVRVTTILEGVCRTLDPSFDFIEIITEYVTEQEASDAVRTEIRETIKQGGRATVKTAPMLETALDVAARGDLVFNSVLKDTNGYGRRMAMRLLLGVLAAAGIPVASFLYVTHGSVPALIPLAGTTVVVVLLMISFRRSRSGTIATPKFTRYEMRSRHDDSD